MAAAGTSNVTKADFAQALLGAIGAPVTPSNVSKLVIWMQHESGGGGGAYNPFDYVGKAPGSSDFNGVHVQNYPDVATGVAATARMFNQPNMRVVTNNLRSDGPWGDYVAAVVNVNAPWTSAAWQQGMLTATEGQAQRYWSTGINGPAGPLEAGSAQAALLAQHSIDGIPIPNPIGSLTPGQLPGGSLNPLNHFIPSLSDILHGDFSKLNPINGVTDWLSSVLPTLITGVVVFVGGAALIVIGLKRSVDPYTRPVTDSAAQAAPIAAAAAL